MILTDVYRRIVSGNIHGSEAVNLDHLRSVARWLTNDNSKNSLLLCGSVGNGKTTTAESICTVICALNESPYMVTRLTAMELVRLKQDEYADKIKHRYLFIDDIGTEPTVKQDYGTKLTPVVELIITRYERRLPTIITTNLSLQGIAERYDIRIADRLKEMCETLVFNQSSYRI